MSAWRRRDGAAISEFMRPPLHVVIVDDDPTILKLISMTLGRALGGAVTTFDGASAAIEAWPTLRPVDVLVTDLTMPGLSGLELGEKLREAQPTLPVIVLSAVDSPVELPPFVRALLIKPCPVRTLVATIDGILEQPQASAQVAPVEGHLAVLKAKYRTHLHSERARFEALLSSSNTPDGARQLRDALHQLAGTSGTYGLTELMTTALEVRSLMVRGTSPDAAGRALLQCLDRTASGAS